MQVLILTKMGTEPIFITNPTPTPHARRNFWIASKVMQRMAANGSMQ